MGVRPADPGKSSRVATEVVRVQGRVMEMSFYSLRAVPLVWSTLGLLNHCQPVGPRPEQAYGYLILGHVANGILVSSLADAWCRRALDIAEQIGTPRDVAWMLSRNAAYQVGRGWWADADAGVHRAVEITRNMGDLRLWAECYGQMGLVALYSGQFERGLQAWAEAERLSRRSDNRQVECWALIGRADILVRLGLYEEALVLYEQGIRKIDLDAMKTEVIWAFGMSALARLRTGDERGAYEAADRALAYIVGVTPVAYWTLQGMAATAEVFLSLYEGASERDGRLRSALARRARGACRGLRRYRRRMALGGPHTFLWCGLRAWLRGRRSRAFRLWRRSLTLAEALQMPYERARAAFEIGRHLAPDADGRRHHLHQAADLFERLGAAADLERARRELSTGEAALPARRA